MSEPVDPALVERFRRDFESALGRALDPAEQIALAVSGGPDSMAMLALAVAAFPGRVLAATVDHGLRAEAADEARIVAGWCAGRDVPHVTLHGREALPGSGIQAHARALRYTLLGEWVRDAGACCLATAHHADDQAETFLMRAVRGSGPAGLASIRRRRDNGTMESVGDLLFRERIVVLIRPLLDWRRSDLLGLVTQAGVPFVHDPSNRDDHYERVRVRRLLSEQPWLDVPGLARAADHAAEADTALNEFRDWLWTSRSVPMDGKAVTGEVLLDIGDLPRELQRRLTRQAISVVRSMNGIVLPAFDERSNVETLLDALRDRRSATRAGVLVQRCEEGWHFREAPPRRQLDPAK